MTCGEKTAKGTPCRRRVTEEGERCHVHSGGKVGRPDGLTPEVAARIVQGVRTGAHLGVAAEAAGISYDTLRRWLKRGEAESHGPYRELLEAVRRAEAEAELRHVALIDRAGQTKWPASAWILARRHPERWGQRAALAPPTDPSGDGDRDAVAGPDLDLSDPDARELFDALLRRRPADRPR